METDRLLDTFRWTIIVVILLIIAGGTGRGLKKLNVKMDKVMQALNIDTP